MPLLFAYGTLNPELAPPAIADAVASFEFVGRGFICGGLYDLGQYRGAVLDTAIPNRIDGNLYSIPADERLLARIDAYEGYDPTDEEASLFVRRNIEVFVGNKTVEAWVYVFNRETSGFPLINEAL